MSESTKSGAAKRRSFRTRMIMFSVPLLLALVGGYLWLTGGRYAETDNAYVQQNMVMIVPEVAGRVTDVGVTENQPVEAGNILFRIDPEPYRIALQQAEAAIVSARLQVEQLRAAYGQAEADLAAARENATYTQSVFERTQKLLSSGTTARAQFEQAENNRQTARQRVAQAEQAVASAKAALMGNPEIATDSHPLVLQKIADRDKAALDLQHTELRAPADGIASQTDRLQAGQYVAPGTSVLALVETGDSWIEANFKETDLTRMKPGQPATVSLDAYPGVEIKGTVASIAQGTGSEFSILPAQNATGNWVKVVQRVPVLVNLDPADVPLRAGLSASVEVDTGATGRGGTLLSSLVSEAQAR